MLTSFDDDDALAAALDAGAAAYLLKSVRGAEITDVIRAVAAGRVLLDERTVTRRKAGHDDPTESLTPSELRVIDLIGEGLSNREIAERLGRRGEDREEPHHVAAGQDGAAAPDAGGGLGGVAQARRLAGRARALSARASAAQPSGASHVSSVPRPSGGVPSAERPAVLPGAGREVAGARAAGRGRTGRPTPSSCTSTSTDAERPGAADRARAR